ncbi:MAG: 2-dehydropantoate 2-reductase [Hyphomicrobiales bacterium]|nr:2-dehydropantoate 2-reductase [Hyphomicrobiales bacterium]
MRIAVIGAGAMGSTFGAHFANAGETVTLFDRDGEHVAAIADGGLRFATPDSDARLTLAATSREDEIGPADMAVVLVDSAATRDVAPLVSRILAADGFAFTLQNGIGNVESLSEILGSERVIGGCTYNSAAKLGPGQVLHSNVGETVIGELDGRSTPRLEALADLFSRAALPIAVSDNVMGHIWMKFVLNAAINPVCAITGLRPGEVARTPPALELLEALLDEILTVVEAKKISLPEEEPRRAVLDHAWERYNRPSMLQHVEAGRQTEIGSLNRALLREARTLGIPCPVNRAITLTVEAIEGRAERRRAQPTVDEQALEAAARAERRPS